MKLEPVEKCIIIISTVDGTQKEEIIVDGTLKGIDKEINIMINPPKINFNMTEQREIISMLIPKLVTDL
jgi:hypothetical protein